MRSGCLEAAGLIQTSTQPGVSPKALWVQSSTQLPGDNSTPGPLGAEPSSETLGSSGFLSIGCRTKLTHNPEGRTTGKGEGVGRGGSSQRWHPPPSQHPGRPPEGGVWRGRQVRNPSLNVLVCQLRCVGLGRPEG